MSMNLRQKVKAAIYPVGNLVPTSHYLGQSFRSWPAVTAVLYDIKVPNAVRPKPAPTPASEANINILLDLLDMTQWITGDIAECGVFRGWTLVPMAIYLAQKRSSKYVLGFDSFEGFDGAIKIDVEVGGEECKDRHVAAFNETSVGLVRKAAAIRNQQSNLGQGLFPGYSKAISGSPIFFRSLGLRHLRILQRMLTVLYLRMNAGGIILFDEYRDPRWPGCTKAIDEYLVDKPEKPVMIMRQNDQKFYIQRL